MNASLVILARSVYGQTLLYPVNEQAKYITALTGTRTLTLSALSVARDMGFIITIEGDTRAAEAAARALNLEELQS